MANSGVSVVQPLSPPRPGATINRQGPQGSMGSRDDSRVVFVGNIPYDGTEQQLAEQFSEVGTVVSFRLVNDRETGKPKGFGFCEYKDAETARSAIRNLNGIMFHGRSLRVDTADDDQASQPGGARQMAPSSAAPATTTANNSKERLGVDAIGQVVDSLSNEQQVEILGQMKTLIESDPDGARRLLHENQQLAQAMLRILILFDAVKPEDIQSLNAVSIPVIQPSNAPVVPPVAIPDRSFEPVSTLPLPPHPPQHLPYDQPPRGFMPHRGPPPIMEPPPLRRRPVTSLPPQKQQLLQTIMAMTPEQLSGLSPEMQAKVAVLRSRMGSRGGGGPSGRPMGPQRPY